ncbi:unnamed protein product [Cochlearia groenlandica]
MIKWKPQSPNLGKASQPRMQKPSHSFSAKSSTRASRSILSSTFGQDLASQRPPLNHQQTRPKYQEGLSRHYHQSG